jgi:hypothetical protein
LSQRQEVRTVDETDVRTALTALADTAAPPARFNIDRTMADGRRGRRRRQAVAGGSALAVGAVIGAIVTMVVVANPASRVSPAVTPQAHATVHGSLPPIPTGSAQPTGGVRPTGSVQPTGSARPASTAKPAGKGTPAPDDVPEQFNPLIPYASFGWLPKGFTTDQSGAIASTNATTITANGDALGSFWLSVMARGGCRDTGATVDCHRNSGEVTGPLPLNDRAPDVNGRPAYWTYDGIMWEYAPGAWAVMTGPVGQAVTLKVAAGVQYGYQTPLSFPFWLSGIPASWQIEEGDYTDSAPPLDAETLQLGPVEMPQAASVTVTPAGGNSTWCQYQQGDSYVTVDGVRALLTGYETYGHSLCVSDLNGQSIVVQVATRIPQSGVPVPGAAAVGGAVGLFKDLHLLGSQVSNWTTDPVR